MLIYKDQLNREVRLPGIPQRIVSVVPSQTELLYSLGLDEEVKGITKFCVHPPQWRGSKTIIGGTKNIHIEKVKALKPDVIIANKEENVKEQVTELEQLAPVWVSDVNNLPGALQMIRSIGEITGKTETASALANSIQKGFEELTPHNRPIRTCYLIWRQPYMTAGGDTFISDILQRNGLLNIFNSQTRYPVIELHQLRRLDCELVLLSSEPYPFKEKHIAEIKAALPNAKVMLVDGEIFSWYGSRLLHAVGWFKGFRSYRKQLY
ncbi:ABC transporter substrate-binding protein [Foetidibacter luteolus]|uniref:ABC transporter substrate-binding protein n=1 Tax=Foetidibacter luteolus TaxID=2608880 RepID=UPI00129B3C99|nr:helical backbone metal receptor [Foetidibacter luteolus]